MRRRTGSSVHLAVILLTVAVGLVSCSASTSEPSESTVEDSAPPTTISSSNVPELDYLADLPVEARASDGGGGPRPPAYWALWNTCAPDNRAAEAKENGGRTAGWVLVDDVLADPGIQLGDHLLASCPESLALLRGLDAEGEDTEDPAYALAAQLLAAELNLNVGAETCPIAEEAIFGAHLVLSTANFDGISVSPLDAEASGGLPRLVELLTAYNIGILCV